VALAEEAAAAKAGPYTVLIMELTDEVRQLLLEGNARRVFTRLPGGGRP
jgi:hypothetical protein